MPDTWYEAWFDKLFIPSEKNTEIIECITDFLRKYHTVHKGTENYAPWKLDRLLAYVRTHPKISPHIEGSVLRRYLTWEQTPSLYVPEESFLSLKSTPFVLAYQTNNPDLLFPEGLRNVAPVEKEKYIQQELLSLHFAILQRHIQWEDIWESETKDLDYIKDQLDHLRDDPIDIRYFDEYFVTLYDRYFWEKNMK